MGAPDLIFELREAGYSIKADGRYLDISPADLPADILDRLKQSKAEILAALKVEQEQEARREKVLARLDTDPAIKRAIYADADSDPDIIIIAIAIRHVATCEMRVPKSQFDPWQLLTMLDRASIDQVH